ncbi:MAG: hypothetical protein LBT03_03715 [Holosporales bacterium]|jgi:adhesin HecA-like repeat protein|nr:hypothetical protein [Holosporales bacterium]
MEQKVQTAKLNLLILMRSTMHFSELIKREVTKLMIAIFVYSNIASAFCMQGVPEFVINIERDQAAAAFKIQVQRRRVASTIIENYVTSTTVMKPQMAAMASLYEALQRANTTIASGIFGGQMSVLPEITFGSKKIGAECFCLSIPELGELFISHDGDVIFDNKEAAGRSMRIIVPRQLILSCVTGNVEVEADSAVLTGITKTSLNSLSFRRSARRTSFGGLFIDKGSELEVGSLSIEDALLLNAGRITIKKAMAMNNSDIFNAGTISTTADQAVMNDIAHFRNAGIFDAKNRLVAGISTFLNKGTFRAKSASVVVAGRFNNDGMVGTTESLYLGGVGEVVNAGTIDGERGEVIISGRQFVHKAGGKLTSSIVRFRSEKTELAGVVEGREVSFRGEVVNTGNIGFEKLELSGKRAIVQNSGSITATKIISDAEEAAIGDLVVEKTADKVTMTEPGKVTADSVSVLSQKHLQISTNMQKLRSIKIDKGGDFLVEEGSSVETVNCLDNSGTATFESQLTELKSIRNSEGARLSLLDKTVVTPDAKGIGIQNDGDLFVRRKVGFGINSTEQDLEIRGTYKASSGASLHAEGGVKILALGFQNDGIVQAESKLKFIQVGAVANETKFGRAVAEAGIEYEITEGGTANLDGDFITPVITGENKSFSVKSDQEIVVSKPVKMNVDLSIEAPKVDVRSEMKVRDLAVKADLFTVTATGYIVSKKNVFIEAGKFENISGKVHALGDVTFNIAGMFVNTGGKVTNKKNIAVTYYTKAPVGINKTFSREHWGWRRKDYGNYPATNEKGGLVYVKLVPCDILAEVEEYFLSVEKAGQIACHRNLSIKADTIDNSYGYLHSRESISAIASTTVLNQVGLMYALLGINIHGIHFFNGLALEHSKHVVNAVDPNSPVITKKSFPTWFELNRRSHRFHGATFSVGCWSNYKNFDVVTDYLSYKDGRVPLPSLKLPGYLYAAGDVSVDAEFDASLGMVVSERDIKIRGRNQGRTANLVSYGNIASEFQKEEVKKMKVEDQSAPLDRLGDFVFNKIAITQKIEDLTGYALCYRTAFEVPKTGFSEIAVQIREFDLIRSRFMTQRLIDGIGYVLVEEEVLQVRDLATKLTDEIKVNIGNAMLLEVDGILQDKRVTKLIDSSSAIMAQGEFLKIRAGSIDSGFFDSYNEQQEKLMVLESSKMFMRAANYCLGAFAIERPMTARFAFTAASIVLDEPLEFVESYIKKSGVMADEFLVYGVDLGVQIRSAVSEVKYTTVGVPRSARVGMNYASK